MSDEELEVTVDAIDLETVTDWLDALITAAEIRLEAHVETSLRELERALARARRPAPRERDERNEGEGPPARSAPKIAAAPPAPAGNVVPLRRHTP